MTLRGTILLSIALALTPAATAQKLRSAEDGIVPLTFSPLTTEMPSVTVKPGDVAWSETVYPAMAARLLVDSVKRSRPPIDGVSAGTLLFGYRLSSGYAYCPPLDIARPTKDVQCYRDLDGDFTFDGGYVTGERNAKKPYFSTFLKGLSSVPKYRYESVDGSLLPPAPARIIFAEMKNGVPHFRLIIGEETLRTVHACETVSPGTCDVMGIRISYTAAEPKGAITINFVAAAPNRTFDVFNSTNPLKT